MLKEPPPFQSIATTEWQSVAQHHWEDAFSKTNPESQALPVASRKVKAMKQIATEFGLSLSVADIFQYPVLSDMARVVARRAAASHEPDPFSLVEIIKSALGSQLKFPLENCQDVYPVTDIQASCIDAALMDPPEGCYYLHADISSESTLESLIDICEKLWNHFDILRTAFIKENGRYLHAISKGIPVPLTVHRSVEDPISLYKQIFDERIKHPLELGALYCDFHIFYSGDKPTRLGIRVTHAHFDGVSHVLLQNCLSSLLDKDSLSRVSSMARYMQYVLSNEDAALAYWRSLLKNSKPLPLFENPKEEKNRIIMSRQTVAAPNRRMDYTKANVFTAACATALANMYQSNDVVFSTVVSGQMMLPPGLSNVTGPCLNITPMRITADEPRTLEQTVAAVHQQRLTSMRFEGSTVSNILKHCTDWPTHLRKLTYTVMFDLAEVSDMDMGSSATGGKSDGHKGLQLELYGPHGPFEKEEGVLLLGMPVEEGWQIIVFGNARFVDQKEIEAVKDHIVGALASA